MMAERYALPGQLIVGTDSHTPHSGALGCLAFGVGTTDMANAFVTGAVADDRAANRCGLISTARWRRASPRKDLVLHLLAEAAHTCGCGRRKGVRVRRQRCRIN